jgi:hypothetical protein
MKWSFLLVSEAFQVQQLYYKTKIWTRPYEIPLSLTLEFYGSNTPTKKKM